MKERANLEENEQRTLKPYACFSQNAERITKIDSHPRRTEFQRDRDRIIHSKAFRRLEYKTQVFLTNKGDHLRTRLTHSLEVAQISRTIALQLGLNTDLVEAIALGHDVGHAPFGHAGERMLNDLLKEKEIGYFKHNFQSVRILKHLEKKYYYEGINLTRPVLEGILKHTDYGNEFITDDLKDLNPQNHFSYTLEGQVVAIADEIAQITHDLDDYLRYKVVNFDSFFEQKIFTHVDTFLKEIYNKGLEELFERSSSLKEHKDELEDYKRDITIKHLVDFLVTTLIDCTEKEINHSLKAMQIDKKYVKFSHMFENDIKDFQQYCTCKMLEDPRIKEMDRRGGMIVSTLFTYYFENPNKLKGNTLKAWQDRGDIAIADHISGMTDRYALEQYNSLIDLS